MVFVPGFHVDVLLAVNLDVSVPARIFFAFSRASAGAVADGITSVAERLFSEAADLAGFELVERMLAFGCQQHEETIVTQVLNVGSPELLISGSPPFADVDVVTFDELFVDRIHALMVRDFSRHVPPITVTQPAACDLLHEAGH